MSQNRIFQVERVGDVLVVTALINASSLAADDVRGESAAILAVFERREAQKAVIDMQRVPFFGSEMLATIHILWKRIRALGGTVAICGFSDLGMDVIRVAKFDMIWSIHPTREAALTALAATA